MARSAHLQHRFILALSSMLLAIPLTQCVSGVDPAPPGAEAGGAASSSTSSGFTATSSVSSSGAGNASSASSSSAVAASSASASSSGMGGGASSSSAVAASSVSASSSGMGGGASSSSAVAASSVSASSSGMGGGAGSSSSAAGSGGAGGMGTHCLENIPPTCPVCETMNASDKPKCMEYLACYLNNNCNPVVDPCGQQDGTCGVNTIGGGYAPRDASIVTYQCACP